MKVGAIRTLVAHSPARPAHTAARVHTQSVLPVAMLAAVAWMCHIKLTQAAALLACRPTAAMVRNCGCKHCCWQINLVPSEWSVRHRPPTFVEAYILCEEGAKGVDVPLAALCLASVQLGFAAVDRGLLLALCLAVSSGT